MQVPHHRHSANVYASGRLDRSHAERSDGVALARMLSDPTTVIVPIWRTRSLVDARDRARASMTTLAAFRACFGEAALERDAGLFLGRVAGTPHFGIDLSAMHEDELEARAEGLGRFVDLRGVGSLMAHDEASLLAYARGLAHWHARHRHCGVCGAPTRACEGGHLRRCSAVECDAAHFPRTDPAVIMLVSDGARVLLGRQRGWAEGVHSVLAGFVEPGESLEDAVAREVSEEVGLVVRDIVYHSSQPWPFPSSLMIGFRALTDPAEPTIDPDELESARWVEAAELRAGSDALRLPRADSIARRLITEWLAEQ